MEGLKDKIATLAEGFIKDESKFLVDVVISPGQGTKRIMILLDGDDGVNIDDCAELSRKIGAHLEEEELMDQPYRLEVSSPGVDYPLALDRQYKKNIGKRVKITMADGGVLEGELVAFDDGKVTLKKKVKKEEMTVEVPLTDIKKTIVQISF